MGENKTFNLKDITSLKHLQDIMLLICWKKLECNYMTSKGSGMAKLPIFSKNQCHFMNNFLGRNS
jgi:hypothetical protein